MTTEKILNKLYVRKVEETDETKKEQIDHICSLLEALPDFDVAKNIPEIERYLSDSVSRLDGDILKVIIDKLKEKISEVEHTTIETMNKTKRLVLNCFLSIIGILAACALVFTVLNFVYGENYCDGLFGKIASAFGTLDFSIGAVGFIWERKEDLKKSELQSAARAARETGQTEKFTLIINKNVNRNYASWFSKVIDNSRVSQKFDDQENEDFKNEK